MFLKRILFIVYLVFFFAFYAYGRDRSDSILIVLDETIALERIYDQGKERKLLELKNQLEECSTSEDVHSAYYQLFKEYEAYIFDSALYYVQKHLEISEVENNIRWINECKMQLARMYSTFASFYEAKSLLNSIDKSSLNQEQTGAYYNSFAELYTYWGEYSSSDEVRKYRSLRDTYRDSALMVIPGGSYSFDINYSRNCIDARKFEEAEKMLFPYLSRMDPDTRDYAILTSLIAYMYEIKGHVGLQKEYLARSAIADIRASIKENTSLWLLAYLMMNEGDINHSNRYIKKSMEDANFYNARLRNVQISKVLPIIDSAFQKDREKYQKRLQLTIVIIVLLSLFLAGIIFYLFRQMKKLAATRREVIQANKELKKINSHLSETNHIKEEYIGRFLNQCSIYIEKLEAYRKSLNKKAASHKMDELFEMLKSSQIIKDELKEFYQNFDNTFLNLFPDFVEQFNALLTEEDRIAPKQENSLTVELRIFALIRLGITDSAKIADFLRYSITTIYNYRSKFRKKSLVSNEKFEEVIMKIGAGNS
ncbi:MAG: DUF6377 domain-containing protein [Tannerella sp.]|jgi:predicted ester cyclase|nr:DUF6377 domain-containing protein [Tannerella sp.]